MKLPEICSAHSGVSATYILEVRNSTGALVTRLATDYQNSIVIEETLSLDMCASYTVNVTVSISLYAELGSHSDIIQLATPWPCSSESENLVY